MSFNPYSVRPIGTEVFNEHLKDVFTESYYFYEPEKESDKNLLKMAETGKPVWESEYKYDPMDRLLFAVTAKAMRDYIHAYKMRKRAEMDHDIGGETYHNSRCLELENDFFRKYDWTESVFEKLLEKIHSLENKHLSLSLIRIVDYLNI